MNPFAEVYNRPEIVSQYLGAQLEKPEIRLLHELVRRPRELAMLDLGIGAGRTTRFFAPFARRYVGIDIAPRMIAACRERHGGMPGCELEVGDAAALDHLPDASFDVVLFSFNGIDCLEPEQRELCLRAVRRLLCPGGIFLFSAHNLQMVDFYFQDPLELTGTAMLISPERRAAILRLNESPAFWAQRDWMLFWDGVYGDEGTLRHVYTRPRHQLDQLRAAGFAHVRALSTITGEELTDIDANLDLSVAYWCTGDASHLA